jgi:thioredoxin-dependent peroxiredoxin
MLSANVSGGAAKRTAADNQTVRNVFVVGPDKRIKLILVYPMTTGHNFDATSRSRRARRPTHGETQRSYPA